MAETKKKFSIGAIWEKKTQTGKVKQSISLDREDLIALLKKNDGKTIYLTAMKNNYKEKDNQPDWNILLPQELQEQPVQQPGNPPQGVTPSFAPPSSGGDDLPF